MTIAVQTAQNGGAASDTAVAQISDTVAAGLSACASATPQPMSEPSPNL
jgi:hypothetical protein